MIKVIFVPVIFLFSLQISAQHSTSAMASVGASVISAVGISNDGNVIEGRLIKPFYSGLVSSNKAMLLDDTSPVFYIEGIETTYSISVLYEPHISLQSPRGARIAALSVIDETNDINEIHDDNRRKLYRVKPVIVADAKTVPGSYTDPGICRVIVNFN